VITTAQPAGRDLGLIGLLGVLRPCSDPRLPCDWGARVPSRPSSRT